VTIEFPPGSTGKRGPVLLRSTNDGQHRNGLTAASPGADVSYFREGASASVPIPLVDLATPDAAHQAGGFVGINAKGEYILCYPDASLGLGATWVTFNFKFDSVFTEAVYVALRNPVNNIGSGSVSWPVTVTRPDTTPIGGANVFVTTDVNGANKIASGFTDAFGVITFQLDPGTYFFWVNAEGFNPAANPQQQTVA
jgi:hypothetical protein